MKQTPTTSVIIPVYNEKDYLLPCLKALHEQTVPIDEIIVVDNNTTDGSVREAKKHYPGVRFLNEPEQGIVFARNRGFDAASGDILVKIDCDSIAYPGWMENLLRTIQGFDGWTGYGDSQELNRFFQPIVGVVFRFFTYRINSLIAGTTIMFGSNLALTKEAWQEIKPNLHMRNDIWEDVDMSLALQNAGLKATASRFIGVSISARSANAPVGVFYRRTLGLPRVYALHGRTLSKILSYIEIHAAFFCWLVLKPLSFIGKNITRRPRPEQY